MSSILQEITMMITVLPEVDMKDVPHLSFHLNQSIMKGTSRGLTKRQSFKVEVLARTYFSIRG
jgi:hypothetical protein